MFYASIKVERCCDCPYLTKDINHKDTPSEMRYYCNQGAFDLITYKPLTIHENCPWNNLTTERKIK